MNGAIHRRCNTTAAIGLLVAAAAAACQDHESVGARQTFAFVVPATGAAIQVTAAQSRELAGTQLRFPGRTFAADTAITIELGGKPIAGGDTVPLGPVVIVGPAGTTLAMSVVLTIPVTAPGASEPVMILSKAAGAAPTRIGATLTADSRAATGYVDRLGAFQAARLAMPPQPRDGGGSPRVPDGGQPLGGRCALDEHCQTGLRCVGGACQSAR